MSGNRINCAHTFYYVNFQLRYRKEWVVTLSNYCQIHVYNMCHFRMIENAIRNPFASLFCIHEVIFTPLIWISTFCLLVVIRNHLMIGLFKHSFGSIIRNLKRFNRHGIRFELKWKHALSSSKYNAFHLTLHRRIHAHRKRRIHTWHDKPERWMKQNKTKTTTI